jgi:tetratricopeptide (TPR) repeat protein
MSEMLANHYFLFRNYNSAKPIYESLLEKESNNTSIKKKLIICLTTAGEVYKALDLFLSMIKDNIDFITSTKIESEEYPCPEIIAEIENQEKLYNSELERIVAIGMLWLYCSLEKSIEFFKKAEKADPKEERFKEITSILIKKLMSIKSHSIN